MRCVFMVKGRRRRRIRIRIRFRFRIRIKEAGGYGGLVFSLQAFRFSGFLLLRGFA